MDGQMFEGLGQLIAVLFWLCVVFVPLGMWKLVEIIWWLATHVHIG